MIYNNMAASWPIQFTKGSRSAVKRCQQSTEEDTIQFCIKKQNLTGYTILPKKWWDRHKDHRSNKTPVPV